MPPRVSDEVDVHVSGATAPARPRRRPASAHVAHRGAHPRRAALIVRRRRVALGLAALAFLTIVLAIAGVLGWIVQLTADVVLVGYFVHLRSEAKRAAAVSRQRRRATAATRAAYYVDDDVADESSAAWYGVPAPARPADDTSWWDETVGDQGASDGWEHDQPAENTGDGRWDPVPVPRPTYQLKPPAPATTPTAPDLDRGAAGQHSEHWDETDDVLARRRAVND